MKINQINAQENEGKLKGKKISFLQLPPPAVKPLQKEKQS